MPTRRSVQPLKSYLLRVAEVRSEQVALSFELVELRSGAVRQFRSLAALRRFLGLDLPDGSEARVGRAAHAR